jgi:hypothetical protein
LSSNVRLRKVTTSVRHRTSSPGLVPSPHVHRTGRKQTA